ncbi:MAG: AAA family ATPase [Alphaproteobacteria bacterium]
MQPNAVPRINGSARHANSAMAYEPTTQIIPPPEAAALVVTDMGALMAMDFPPAEPILAPFLREKTLGMIYAGRGVGKTWVSSEIAYAVARGGSALGKWTAPKARKVLYIDGEMAGAAIKERFAVIGNNAPTEPAPGYLRFIAADLQLDFMPDLSTPEGKAVLEPHLHGVDLIILDNLSTLARTGEENANESWRPMQEWALEQRRKGRSVLFVHHAGKGGQQRGASSREDILDFVIALKHSENYTPEDGARFEVHFEKARSLMGADVAPFEAKLEIHYHSELGQQAKWQIKGLEEQRLAAVVELIRGGMTVRQVGEELHISKSAVDRLKRKAESKGLLTVGTHAKD